MPVETKLYDTLGVSPTASSSDIKRAYRKLALEHHPDKGGDEEEFKKITGAYEILKDEEKRGLYDQFGADGLKNSGRVPSDLFTSLFGGTPIGGIFNMFQDMRNAVRKQPPVVYNRVVTLEELCTRKVIKIKVTRDRVCVCQQNLSQEQKCPTCNGLGRIQQRRVISQGMIQQINTVCVACSGRGVKIQSCGNCNNGVISDPKIFSIYLTPDMGHQYQYKFAGEGNEIPGVLPGDFIVVILIKPHEQYKVVNKNLLYTRKTTLKEILCGYNSLILHPSGENTELSFKGVINPKEPKVIKGKGLDSTGDLVVLHDVVFPETLTGEQMKKIGEILS